MKKFLFLALTVMLTAASCSPVRIVMNSKGADGVRTVLTSDKHLFGNIDIALGARIINPKDTVLAILITSTKDSDHGIFDKDDQLLIRLADGSDIALTNLYDKEFDRHTTTEVVNERVSNYGYAYSYDYYGGIYVTPMEISSFVPRSYTRTESNSYALYLVSKKQLQDIIAKGVSKLRVEIEDAELDMPSTNSVSAIVTELYACLREGMANSKKRTAF